MRVIGLAGWSGAGKTTVVTRLIPELSRRGLTASTLKHAHHSFDLDTPGKDSWQHRAAGAREVLIASPNRLALMREFRGAPAPTLPELLRLFSEVDIVLIEGFRRDAHPKIEIFRTANGKAPLWPEDPHIVALASDLDAPPTYLPHAHIDDIASIADLALAHAERVDVVIETLESVRPA